MKHISTVILVSVLLSWVTDFASAHVRGVGGMPKHRLESRQNDGAGNKGSISRNLSDEGKRIKGDKGFGMGMGFKQKREKGKSDDDAGYEEDSDDEKDGKDGKDEKKASPAPSLEPTGAPTSSPTRLSTGTSTAMPSIVASVVPTKANDSTGSGRDGVNPLSTSIPTLMPTTADGVEGNLDIENNVERVLSVSAFQYDMLSEVEPSQVEYLVVARITQKIFAQLYMDYYSGMEEFDFSHIKIHRFTVLDRDLVKYDISIYFKEKEKTPSLGHVNQVAIDGFIEGREFYDLYLERLQELISNEFATTVAVRYISDAFILDDIQPSSTREGTRSIAIGHFLKVFLPLVAAAMCICLGSFICCRVYGSDIEVKDDKAKDDRTKSAAAESSQEGDVGSRNDASEEVSYLTTSTMFRAAAFGAKKAPKSTTRMQRFLAQEDHKDLEEVPLNDKNIEYQLEDASTLSPMSNHTREHHGTASSLIGRSEFANVMGSAVMSPADSPMADGGSSIVSRPSVVTVEDSNDGRDRLIIKDVHQRAPVDPPPSEEDCKEILVPDLKTSTAMPKTGEPMGLQVAASQVTSKKPTWMTRILKTTGVYDAIAPAPKVQKNSNDTSDPQTQDPPESLAKEANDSQKIEPATSLLEPVPTDDTTKTAKDSSDDQTLSTNEKENQVTPTIVCSDEKKRKAEVSNIVEEPKAELARSVVNQKAELSNNVVKVAVTTSEQAETSATPKKITEPGTQPNDRGDRILKTQYETTVSVAYSPTRSPVSSSSQRSLIKRDDKGTDWHGKSLKQTRSVEPSATLQSPKPPHVPVNTSYGENPSTVSHSPEWTVERSQWTAERSHWTADLKSPSLTQSLPVQPKKIAKSTAPYYSSIPVSSERKEGDWRKPERTRKSLGSVGQSRNSAVSPTASKNDIESAPQKVLSPTPEKTLSAKPAWIGKTLRPTGTKLDVDNTPSAVVDEANHEVHRSHDEMTKRELPKQSHPEGTVQDPEAVDEKIKSLSQPVSATPPVCTVPKNSSPIWKGVKLRPTPPTSPRKMVAPASPDENDVAPPRLPTSPVKKFTTAKEPVALQAMHTPTQQPSWAHPKLRSTLSESPTKSTIATSVSEVRTPSKSSTQTDTLSTVAQQKIPHKAVSAVLDITNEKEFDKILSHPGSIGIEGQTQELSSGLQVDFSKAPEDSTQQTNASGTSIASEVANLVAKGTVNGDRKLIAEDKMTMISTSAEERKTIVQVSTKAPSSINVGQGMKDTISSFSATNRLTDDSSKPACNELKTHQTPSTAGHKLTPGAEKDAVEGGLLESFPTDVPSMGPSSKSDLQQEATVEKTAGHASDATMESSQIAEPSSADSKLMASSDNQEQPKQVDAQMKSVNIHSTTTKTPRFVVDSLPADLESLQTSIPTVKASQPKSPPSKNLPNTDSIVDVGSSKVNPKVTPSKQTPVWMTKALQPDVSLSNTDSRGYTSGKKETPKEELPKWMQQSVHSVTKSAETDQSPSSMKKMPLSGSIVSSPKIAEASKEDEYSQHACDMDTVGTDSVVSMECQTPPSVPQLRKSEDQHTEAPTVLKPNSPVDDVEDKPSWLYRGIQSINQSSIVPPETSMPKWMLNRLSGEPSGQEPARIVSTQKPVQAKATGTAASGQATSSVPAWMLKFQSMGPN